MTSCGIFFLPSFVSLLLCLWNSSNFACSYGILILITVWYSIMQMDHNLFIHFTVSGHSEQFLSVTVRNNDALNIYLGDDFMHFCWENWYPVVKLLGHRVYSIQFWWLLPKSPPKWSHQFIFLPSGFEDQFCNFAYTWYCQSF